MPLPPSPATGRRIVLAARPRGLPSARDFRLEQVPVPEPGDGQVLLRTLHLSLDPYMRQQMDEVAPVYASSVPLGAPMPGEVVGRVVASRHPRLREGELVLGAAGWQEYAALDGDAVTPLGSLARPSRALGVLGMPAFTAYVGLLDIGRPRAGETLVVAAATGAVGAVAGQIGKLEGMRVVGIAGGADKCRHAVEVLGFDACLDRHAPDLPGRLAQACPDGIDVYFENVGGAVLDAVLPLLNIGARIPLVGHIADYNGAGGSGPDRRPALLAAVLQKRIRMQGMIILDHYADRLDAFRRDMETWLAQDRITAREHRVDGLERAPDAFIDLLEGRNFGKVVVRVADDGD
ncbi:MAG TPA: NADP-dependent oxidoreductase [Luteimonas sp.]|nr:NADP-dependent oxidoreductase [Luteimonas sp.]